MRKERARRRAEREAAAARAAEARAVRLRRAARWRGPLDRLRRLVPVPVRQRRPGGLLARRRRAQNGGVLLVFLAVQCLAWLLCSTWTARLAVLGLSIFLVPVVVTLAFDRRA
ncbi:hypothetical protein ACRYCC_40425 [Actinomadura scrupuli]|uniref:hypothetical protein n=1 Tax=Actinomadura scrupuli TaxID=559629 RepID=UPI003D951546